MIIYNLKKFTIEVHNTTITIPAQEIRVDLLRDHGYFDLLHEGYDLILLRLVDIEHIGAQPLSPYDRLTIDVCDEYDPYFVYQRIEHVQR